jgi:hypothetical protein
MEQQPLHTSEVKPLAATQPPHTSETKQLAATPQPLHRDDADDDDENVKQLDECSSLYLLMQVNLISSSYFHNPKPLIFFLIH